MFNWLYAKKHAGRFLIRVEDTDRERSTDEAVNAIFDGLSWLELFADEEPVFQFSRADRHREVVDQLLESGHAYRDFTSAEETGRLRDEAKAEKRTFESPWRDRAPTVDDLALPHVVRFRRPQSATVTVPDEVQGPVSWSTDDLDDLVLLRSDGAPTYNLAVVVDDHDMGVTHVIRGDDHLNNAARQSLIYDALGWVRPTFAHIPLIHGPDGAKLSKRHGALGVMEYRAMGFLPEALLNYLVRLGWSHGDQELFTRQEMIEKFDLSKVSSSAARFDMEKAYWVNHQYLKSVDPEVVAPEFDWHLRRLGVDPANGPALVDVILSQRERCRTLLEMAEKSAFLYAELTGYNEKDAAKHFNADGINALTGLNEALKALQTWDAPTLHAAVNGYAESAGLGLGKVAQPLRVAIVGMAVSPPIDQTLALLGRERTLARLDAAVAWARSRA